VWPQISYKQTLIHADAEIVTWNITNLEHNQIMKMHSLGHPLQVAFQGGAPENWPQLQEDSLPLTLNIIWFLHMNTTAHNAIQ